MNSATSEMSGVTTYQRLGKGCKRIVHNNGPRPTLSDKDHVTHCVSMPLAGEIACLTAPLYLDGCVCCATIHRGWVSVRLITHSAGYQIRVWKSSSLPSKMGQRSSTLELHSRSQFILANAYGIEIFAGNSGRPFDSDPKSGNLSRLPRRRRRRLQVRSQLVFTIDAEGATTFSPSFDATRLSRSLMLPLDVVRSVSAKRSEAFY
ncbi:uncharacterized protein MYCFIDRAFT_180682 [Pseudocercospora fijiensis CIRAD86]|uniref:Uncharacterized protein n=1 Tax=Pseudocercospora fijiensis (strain CIRAD86) TaxID=383855 RepID=M2YG53_PSEFD|nr:uncharacterized protein MYCFIDRAFT_180682 [Pseudocercospora fijiensis CIRAD86]EME76780.1 hypothetical protein MYCFIDRAFT_180682 [Pseudocercospora fijiensis CIRAD86]